MFYQLDILHWAMWWIVLLALIVCVGATNIINFMDGVNGITGGYSLAVLVPLLLNEPEDPVYGEFVFDCHDFVRSGILSVQFPSEKPGEVLCWGCGKYRNRFYPIVLYREISDTDRRYNLAVFSCRVRVDGCLTICHRIMLHENWDRHIGSRHTVVAE